MKDKNGYDPEYRYYQEWVSEQTELAREESGYVEEEEEDETKP